MMLAHERVVNAFDRAASTYNQHAVLQKRVLLALLGLLQGDTAARYVIDLGCGTGLALPLLQQVYPHACCIGLDVSYQMSLVAQAHADAVVCADFSCLPIRPGVVDVLLSSLALQWAIDLPQVLSEACRLLRPGGSFYFSILLPGSLKEIEDSWRGLRLGTGVNDFCVSESVVSAFEQAGYVPVLTSEETEVCYYDDVRALCQSLRLIGANQVMGSSGSGLLGRERWSMFEENYEAKRVAAGLPLTYQVMYGIMSKKRN